MFSLKSEANYHISWYCQLCWTTKTTTTTISLVIASIIGPSEGGVWILCIVWRVPRIHWWRLRERTLQQSISSDLNLETLQLSISSNLNLTNHPNECPRSLSTFRSSFDGEALPLIWSLKMTLLGFRCCCSYCCRRGCSEPVKGSNCWCLLHQSPPLLFAWIKLLKQCVPLLYAWIKKSPPLQYAWIKLMSALPIIAQPVASRFRIWSHGAWEGNILCHKITGARLVEGLVTSPTSYNVVATLRKTAPQVVASLHESKQKSSWNCLEFKIKNVWSGRCILRATTKPSLK